MRRILAVVAALGVFCALPALALADEAPTEEGKCVVTTITRINWRFEDEPDSGSLVEYATGTIGVSYHEIPAITRSKVGDKVELCLVTLPGEECPANDRDRGILYAAVNLRTQEFWELYNSEHLCGGA